MVIEWFILQLIKNFCEAVPVPSLCHFCKFFTVFEEQDRRYPEKPYTTVGDENVTSMQAPVNNAFLLHSSNSLVDSGTIGKFNQPTARCFSQDTHDGGIPYNMSQHREGQILQAQTVPINRHWYMVDELGTHLCMSLCPSVCHSASACQHEPSK
jgi:hypothetical protein